MQLKIVQATWVRYHHFDLAQILYQLGVLEQIFTCLPWWKANVESKSMQIPIHKIRCNFLLQGIRRIGWKLPWYSSSLDAKLSVVETMVFSRWVAKNLPPCDVFIGISGTGLHAGRLVKSRGGAYIMDRGSTQIRYANQSLREEHERWGVRWQDVHPWLIENEETEADEATLITVPSDFVKQSFIASGINAKKVRVVPYGVSLEHFYPVGHPPTDIFRLVFVGQFSLRKGAPYLLEAFKTFRHPFKELIIVGNVAENMKPLIAKIGADCVRFVGPVPRFAVKEYMSTAHALVLPSIEEGLALVQAQAMACGCPVIATPNTGADNLFENGREGFIVDVRSVNALVTAFETLASNRNLREEMSEACMVRVKSFGGWKVYGEHIFDVAKEAFSMHR